MTLLRRIAAIAAAVFALTLVGVAVQALWFTHVAPPPRPAGVIIVLGGSMTDENLLGAETRARVLEGVRLFQAGLAPRIHFTGGVPDRGQPGAGDQMMALAIAAGVPASAASAENHSRSTLQNALFSQDILGPAATGPVILVTDGFHLGRSWASFRWAGYREIGLDAPSAFGDQTLPEQGWRVVREALAWWFNLARVGIWEVGQAIDPDPRRVDMLR